MAEELSDYLDEALEHAQNNPYKLCDGIKPVFLEVIKEEAENAGSNDGNNFITGEETEQLIDYVAESIGKFTLEKLAGKI